MNIRTKVLVTFLLSSIPAIGLVGAINYENAKSIITNDVLEKLDGIATVQEKRVEESIERNFERLDGIKMEILKIKKKFKQLLKMQKIRLKILILSSSLTQQEM